jgi:glutathione S-transferase
MITISAFKWVPPFAQGQVRDLRARWALEEAGLPYKTRLLEQGDQDKADYREMQPFGQVPILQEDSLVLFESGAIVLYIAERSEMLLPKDSGARARDAMACRCTQFHRALRHECRVDRSFLRE